MWVCRLQHEQKYYLFIFLAMLSCKERTFSAQILTTFIDNATVITKLEEHWNNQLSLQ
jgi:hypothetical protein